MPNCDFNKVALQFFSNNFNKLCCALKLFLIPHCCLESIPSRYDDTCL